MTFPHFTFSFLLSPLLWGLLGAALVLGVAYGLWVSRRASRLARHLLHDERVRRYCPQLPTVSVVVYANDDGQCLKQFLPLMLEQDYPAPFEVIVVDDASTDGTKDIVSDMMTKYKGLKFTYIPDATRSLSRKKLSLMLGIKAAFGEVILTTNANCRVVSDKWLQLMMRNFVPGVDVVIGYSHFRHSDDRGPGKAYRVFDRMMSTSQYLVAAVNGKPFRGISDNLAFRRATFFANKGYSKSLELRWGDDDVFLCEVVREGNTRVEMSPKSRVIAYYDGVAHAHSVLKSRRDFTLGYVPVKGALRTNAFMSLLWWLRTAALVAAVALNYTNFAVATLAVVVLLLTAFPVMVAALKCSYMLRLPLMFFSAPWNTLMRPLVNMAYAVKGLFTRKTNMI